MLRELETPLLRQSGRREEREIFSRVARLSVSFGICNPGRRVLYISIHHLLTPTSQVLQTTDSKSSSLSRISSDGSESGLLYTA